VGKQRSRVRSGRSLFSRARAHAHRSLPTRYQRNPKKDRTAITMTTAPTSQMNLFTMSTFG
jgi:hypothetical protein